MLWTATSSLYYQKFVKGAQARTVPIESLKFQSPFLQSAQKSPEIIFASCFQESTILLCSMDVIHGLDHAMEVTVLVEYTNKVVCVSALDDGSSDHLIRIQPLAVSFTRPKRLRDSSLLLTSFTASVSPGSITSSLKIE